MSIAGIYNTGYISAASNVLQSASNSRIGTITNSGTLSGGTGFNLDNSAIGTITNSGLITATGSNGPVSMSGTTSAAALVNTSTGTLTGSQGSASALQVFGTATSLTLLDNAGLMKAATGIKLNGTIGALNNSGTILGTSSSGNALSISSAGRIGAFNNTGAIQGNITDLRTGGLTITGGAGGVYGSLMGAAIGASGTITAAGNVTLNGNTALNSNVTSASGTGTITNTGVLYVQRSTTLTGAYSQPAEATLQIGVVSTSVYGQLNVSSGVTLTSGASIVMMAAPSGTLAAGSYTIFSGPIATDYSGLTVTAPSSGLDIATASTVVSSTNNFVVTLTAPITPPVVSPPVVSPPVVTPPAAVIDTSKSFFSGDESALQSSTVTFDGGTLKPDAPLTLTQTVIVGSSNGAVDPNGGVVTLSGSITGPGRLTVTGSGSLVVSGSVSNSGGMNVQSGGLTVARGGNVSGPVRIDGGAVTVEQGGTVSAPVTVGNGAVTIDQGGTVASTVTVESGGTAKVNGEVNGAVNVAEGATLGGGGRIGGDTSVSGVLAPGNSPGTLVFTAPVTLNASATYQVEIDGAGTGSGAGNHDQVVVAGSSFAAGGRLTPILRGISGAATNSYTPALGQTFEVVSASGGIAGRFTSLVQPAAGLAAGTRFDVIYAPTTVTLAVTPGSYADLAAAGLAQSDNQRAVGAALESFRPAAGA
ncbi:MAG TPA: polymer-forming cytoskeletal protein, partial [Phenylobacterium sp.]|nr:polymer-forming cytoskeletal protein [Phenylobacterium sp.]